MENQELRSYVDQSRNVGVPDGEIRRILIGQGWAEADITPFLPQPSASAQPSISGAPYLAPEIAPAKSPEPAITSRPTSFSIPSMPMRPADTAVMAKPVSEPPHTFVPPLSSMKPTPNVAPVAAPAVSAVPKTFTPMAAAPAASGKHRSIYAVILAAVIILIGGAAAFAYTKNILPPLNFWPFSRSPYASSEVLTKGLARFSEINTAQYKFSLSFGGEKREAGAVPFSYDQNAVSAAAVQLLPSYQRDANKIALLKQIVSDLQGYIMKKKALPASLSVLAAAPSYFSNFGTNPYTQYANLLGEFSYAKGADGKTYTIAATFETDDAVKNFSAPLFSYSSASTGATVAVKTVTLNEKYPYVFSSFSGIPPAPPIVAYLQSRDQALQLLPSQVSLNLSMTGSADFGKKDPNAKKSGSVSIDGTASFGDSLYGWGVEAKIIGDSLYFRINKFPSLPGLAAFFDPTSIKGVWVKIDKNSIASSTPGFGFPASGAAANIPDAKVAGVKLASAYSALYKIVQDENLVSIAGNPQNENVDGQNVYTYTLILNAKNLPDAYARMVKEVFPILSSLDTTGLAKFPTEPDPQVMSFLKSDLFQSYFDYAMKNSAVTLSFTSDGLPQGVRYHSRMIPLAESTRLAGQEYTLNLGYSFVDINKPIVIDEPKDFITFEVAQEKVMGQSLNEAKAKAGDAKRIADIKQLQLALELYFDANHKYPATLGNGQLVPTYIPSIPTPPAGSIQSAYSYAPLSAPGKGSCGGYHLGAALESSGNSVLQNDSDESGGPKASGCGGTGTVAPDFNGKGPDCISAGATDSCFDVTP